MTTKYMPYFIFQVNASASDLVKNLSLIQKFNNYKQAKSHIHDLRDNASKTEPEEWKMIFADSQLQAEELLQEKRDAPVLMEWEK